MTSYAIRNREVNADDPDLPRLLIELYESKERPLCICRKPGPGIPMQLAKVNGHIIIKRMPNSGSDHSAGCDSYDPPPELSGLGQVMGSAIQEDAETGATALKFDFAMTKTATRAAPVAGGGESDTVKTDGNKLTLRAALHYLWDDAGFSKWWPNMTGKRSWYVIRKFLLQSAENKIAKGAELATNLYVPESFSTERKDAITQRRVSHLMKIATPDKGTRRLMILIGEVKEITQSRYGYKVIVKHVPDYHFMMPEDMHKRLHKRFSAELALWDAIDNSHLMLIATFGVSAAGVASIEECALMVTTENWIPYENTFDKELIDLLTSGGRRFVKGLRYNLASSQPLASVVLTDTQPQPTAMYIVTPGMSDAALKNLDELIAESKLQSWVWKAGQESMPPIPPAQGRS